jgi:hypothetical protein
MDIINDYLFTMIVFIIPIMYSIQPLLLPRINTLKTSNNNDILRRKKIVLYRQIKELEMEYDIGNLDKEDFINRRSELKTEVSEIIAELKKK